MASFSRNLLANFAGVGVTGAMQLLCVPFYVRLMGLESYALVGFFLTLQATLQVLDLGIAPTLNRELARFATQPGRAAEMRSFVRTFELGSWAMGLLLGAAIAALSPVIAHRWIDARGLPPETVTRAVLAMGALVALQWPLSLYQAGLQGLERQVPLNALRAVMATASGVGGVLVLWAVSPRIEVFFAWQMATSAVHVLLMALLLWRHLPAAPERPRAQWALVRPALGFTASMGAMTFLGMLLVQMDKLVLSALLPLEAFGAYVLASTVVNGLQLFIRPLYTALFPRLSSLVAVGDEGPVRQLYHQGSQLMAVLVLPAAVVLAVFSREALQVWTGDPAVATRAAPLVTVLAVGTALNGLMHVPYALQLAYGWTRIGLLLTVGKVVVFFPLLLWAATHHGALGAASVWALLNISYVAVGVPWTHQRLLQGSAGRWLLKDVALPLAPALAVALLAGLWAPRPDGTAQALFTLAVVAVLAQGSALVASGGSRAALRQLTARAVGAPPTR